jgi:hypothetical protein
MFRDIDGGLAKLASDIVFTPAFTETKDRKIPELFDYLEHSEVERMVEDIVFEEEDEDREA